MILPKLSEIDSLHFTDYSKFPQKCYKIFFITFEITHLKNKFIAPLREQPLKEQSIQ